MAPVTDDFIQLIPKQQQSLHGSDHFCFGGWSDSQDLLIFSDQFL